PRHPANREECVAADRVPRPRARARRAVRSQRVRGGFSRGRLGVPRRVEGALNSSIDLLPCLSTGAVAGVNIKEKTPFLNRKFPSCFACSTPRSCSLFLAQPSDCNTELLRRPTNCSISR